MNHFRRLYLNSRGQAAVELALVLPIVMMVLLGTVELSNMFLISLRVSNMSREVANAAFRDCAYLPDADQSQCLSSTAARIRDEGNLLLRDFSGHGTVVASTYAASSNSAVRLVDSQSVGNGKHPTRYNESRIDAMLANSYKRLTVGEVFYGYTPITPVGSLFSYLKREPVIYEVTIF